MDSVLQTLCKGCTDLYTNQNHKGYLIQWSLISPLCKKWSRNRDCDLNRVEEMIDFRARGGYIPSMIHFADVQDEGLVCYDGNHRREVFNRCLAEGDDIICIVDVMFGASQSDVYKAFSNVNKSVQVPAIYLNEPGENVEVKDAILRLVKTYEEKYKEFLSTSARCHAPHFNRDTFVDNVDAIYKALPGISVTDIEHTFTRLNIEYSKGRMCRPHSSYRPSIIAKCKRIGLWLFLDKTVPVAHVEQILKKNLRACCV